MLVLAAIFSAAATLHAAWLRRVMEMTNREIAALHAGHDRPVANDAAPELLLARIEFLAKRDDVDNARPLLVTLDATAQDDLAAKAHYALGNALLRRAFELIERGDLDEAGPFVNLSKREYRRALQLWPSYWDAKFNFDVAARLIRDYPAFEQENGDVLEAEPKKLWTDVPGVPKGLP
ncbi:MxaK protein [Methylocystis bryophila]|uniref:MxaK protein n=1 Tax=Methylocystis bryophila TaxID=655015 RepID=A0A1W6N0M3_9HYPH|nr:MxaK protein [Methylocystis bryophila]